MAVIFLVFGFKEQVDYKCEEIANHDLITELNQVMEDAHVKEWFSFYNPEYAGKYFVHDGYSWYLEWKNIAIDGNNCYPKPLKDIISFLEREFGLYVELDDDTVPFPASEKIGLMHLASLKGKINPNWLQSSLLYEIRKDDPYFSVDNEFSNAANLLTHELSSFVCQNPRYRNYQEILDKYELNPDFEFLNEINIENMPPEAIVALMIAAEQFDYVAALSDVYLNVFNTCVRDGTFCAWLKKLDEILTSKTICM